MQATEVEPVLSASDAYHESDGLASSQITEYKDDPVQWYHWRVLKDWKREPTKAMKLGTTIHDMIEFAVPHMASMGGWESLVSEIPADVLNKDGHCKGSAWNEWKDANPAEIYFKPWEQNPLRLVWDNLLACSFTRDLITGSRKEVAHHWHDEDFGLCKVKFDALAISQPLFADWKTTCKKKQHAFEKDIVDRCYDMRLAFYRRGFRDLFGEDPRIYIVAINTSGSYRVTPFELPRDWLDDAEARLILTVDEMRRFDLDAYLDSKPKTLNQPNFSKVNFDELDD